jgi:hypothetical protein
MPQKTQAFHPSPVSAYRKAGILAFTLVAAERSEAAMGFILHFFGVGGKPMGINDLTSAIIGAAIEVHKRLGPGQLESAYRVCLAYELRKRGLDVVEEKPVPVIYDDVKLEFE